MLYCRRLVQGIDLSFPMMFIVRGYAYRGPLDLAHHFIGQPRLFGPLPGGALGVEHGQM